MDDTITFIDTAPAAVLGLGPSASARAGLYGQVALITGGGRGLGAVIAQVLGESGMRVVLADTDLQRAQDRAAILGERDIPAMPLALDVGDEGQCAEAVAAVVRRFGRLDVLIDNAAHDARSPLTSPRPTRLIARLATAQMHRQSGGGHVVHMASSSVSQTTAGIPPAPQASDAFVRVSGVDDIRLQDPLHVAQAVRHVLQQPEGAVTVESTAPSTLESAWP